MKNVFSSFKQNNRDNNKTEKNNPISPTHTPIVINASRINKMFQALSEK